jgi:hypothetical protein
MNTPDDQVPAQPTILPMATDGFCFLALKNRTAKLHEIEFVRFRVIKSFWDKLKSAKGLQVTATFGAVAKKAPTTTPHIAIGGPYQQPNAPDKSRAPTPPKHTP